jgi:hypothetical protein
LGERLLCKQEVDGSIPFTSTTPRTKIVLPNEPNLEGPRQVGRQAIGRSKACAWAWLARLVL